MHMKCHIVAVSCEFSFHNKKLQDQVGKLEEAARTLTAAILPGEEVRHMH